MQWCLSLRAQSAHYVATALLLSIGRRVISCEKASRTCRLATSGTVSESTAVPQCGSSVTQVLMQSTCSACH